jgi:hypothetical protein
MKIITWIIYFSILFYWIGEVQSIIVDTSINVKPYLREFQLFGFDKGGVIKLTGTTEPSGAASSTRIFVCNNAEFTSIVNDANINTGGICFEPSLSEVCELSVNMTINIQNYVIPSKDCYHFLIINCAGSTNIAHLDYTLLNPNGQQLSLGYEPLPTFYLILTVFWFMLLLGWIFVWIYYRRIRVPLHSLLLFVTFLKSLVVVVALFYWHICEETGYCLDQLKFLQSFFFAVSETSFFCALLLIAKGWRITRMRLPSSEIRTISVALMLLLSTLLFFSFYNDGYYFLSLMIMYFFMLPKIFTSITRNTRALETQLLFIMQSNTDTETNGIVQKIKLFKTLRSSVVLYLGSILLVNSMRIIMIWYLDWLNYVMNEIVTLLMVSTISYILLPHHRALFSSLGLEANLLSLFNMDEIFDPESIINYQDTYSPDISDIAVVEYPSKNSESKNYLHPNSIPLAMVILEKPKEEKDV